VNALRLNDVRFAIRRLRKHPAATLASVAALACGIGAAVATWSLLSAVLLKPLAVEAPDRLYEVDPSDDPGPTSITFHSYPVFEAIANSGTFDGVAAGSLQGLPVVEHGDVPQDRDVYFANQAYFATLGVGAVRGRTFTEAEDRRGAPPVAVLSDHYWRSVFGADPDVLGRTVTVSGTLATIVGILPRGFRGLHLTEAPDLYLPLHVIDDIDYYVLRGVDRVGPYSFWLRIAGRLRPGDTAEAATERLNAIPLDGEPMRDAYTPLALTNVNVAAIPAAVRASMTQFTTLLSLTVGLLLMIGCLTVGMLMLVRTEDRREELAVCLALGATRARLACGIAVEAAILCVFGAVLAVSVAVGLFYGIRAFQLPGRIDVARLTLTLDPGSWLMVTVAVLAATCVIASLASLVGVGTAHRSPVQPRAFATPRITRRTPRTVLVAGQVAITLVLVTGAGLFTRSLIEALSLNTGVDTDRIVTAFINLRGMGYSAERSAAFFDELRERLSHNGTIESVSVYGGAFSGGGFPVPIDGARRKLPSDLRYVAVDDNFFSTMELPIVNGRGFASSDVAGAPLVVVVSESLARLIADGGDPIGHRISDSASIRRVLLGQGPPDYAEVIGVVPDLITDVNTIEPLVVYHSIAQRPPTQAPAVAVRASGDPDAAMREVVAAVRALDRRVTPSRMLTLDQQIGNQMNPQRFGIYVLGALGGIALLLTVLGTYVIAESMVVRRRREMSIRAALGARGAHLLGLVLRDTARLVGVGLATGLVMAALGARLIRSLLYQVEPLDPIVLAGVAAMIFCLTLLVSLRPALEATRLDLTRALREE
jgi:putative ABC transport system permease protein